MAAQFLTSCSGCSNSKKSTQEVPKDTTVKVKPFSLNVKGYLSDVLEVVDGEYSLNYTADMVSKISIQVRIKSVGMGNPNDYGFKDGNNGPLYITICDKNGAPITRIPQVESSFENDGILKNMMKKKEENWILFDGYIYNRLPREAATFIISSKEITPHETEESSSLDEEDKVSSADKEKWDKILDDYEEYVDKTVAIMKKINRNDNVEAVLDYPALLKKAKDLQESLDEAKSCNSLTPEQIERMARIQLKVLRVERRSLR